MLVPCRSLFIGIPLYSHEMPVYLYEWLSEIRLWYQKHDVKCAVKFVEGKPQLSVSRSQLFAEFIDYGYDDLLCMDGDMLGTIDNVVHIQSLDEGAVSGMYMNRHDRKLMHGMSDYTQDDTRHLVEISYVPMGFFRIRRKQANDLFYSMEHEYPIFNYCTLSGRALVNVYAQGMYNSVNNTGRWWHDEDYAFSYHYHTRIGKIYIDRRLRIKHRDLAMREPCIPIQISNQT